MKNKQKHTAPSRVNPWIADTPANMPVLILRALHSDLIEIIPELESIPHLRDKAGFDQYVEQLNCISIDNCPLRFGAVYQLRDLLKKYQWSGDRDKTQSAAIQEFIDCDAECGRNNKRLRKLESRYLELVKEEILNVLPPFDMQEVMKHARHGPGGSNRLCKDTSAYSKYRVWPYTVSAGCHSRAIEAIGLDDRWRGALDDSLRNYLAVQDRAQVGASTSFLRPIGSSERFAHYLETRSYNRVTTVPKNDLKDRPIAIEPVMNCYLQLGVDGVIRRQLRQKWGYDLNDQRKNGYLALIGSRDDSYATIDLSSASDLISLRLCKRVLPAEWFKVLMSLRSPRGLLPSGDFVRYRKISSMGNGTTFALESLIFGACTRVACKIANCDPTDSAVYGDDLIVPKTAQYPLRAILEICGFRVNSEKSFTAGPFRESCGMDWYDGNYVRPYHLKQLITVSDWYACYNRLQYWGFAVFGGLTLKNTKAILLKYLKPPALIYGPHNMLDFTSYLHDVTKDDGLVVVQRSKDAQPGDWFFGRLLAKHKMSVRTKVRNPNILEDVAYKAFLEMWDLPDVVQSGSIYTVNERESARQFTRQERDLRYPVYSYQNLDRLLIACFES